MESKVTNKAFKIKALLRLSTDFEKQEIMDFKNETNILRLLDSMIMPRFIYYAESFKGKSFYDVKSLDLNGAIFCDSEDFNEEVKYAILKLYICSRDKIVLNLPRVKESLVDLMGLEKKEYLENSFEYEKILKVIRKRHAEAIYYADLQSKAKYELRMAELKSRLAL